MLYKFVTTVEWDSLVKFWPLLLATVLIPAILHYRKRNKQ
jgi:hypothetical protein